MNRRTLFKILAGAAIDPERLIWEPGKKLISIPATRTVLVPTVELDFASMPTVIQILPMKLSFAATYAAYREWTRSPEFQAEWKRLSERPYLWFNGAPGGTRTPTPEGNPV